MSDSITSDSIPQLRHAQHWQGHTAPLSVMAATSDMLIGGGREGILTCWPLDGEPPFTLTVSNAGVTALLPTEKGLIAGYGDAIIRVWDPPTSIVTAEWNAHHGPVQALLPYGDTIFSAGADRLLIAWTPDGQVAWSQQVAPGEITDLALRGDILFAACDAGTLHAFNAESGEPLGGYVVHDAATVSVSVHPVHGWLLTAGGGRVRDWDWDGSDLHDGAVEISLPRLRRATYNSDGSLIYAHSAAREQHLTAWHAEDGRLAGIIAPRADAFTLTGEAIYIALPKQVSALRPDPSHRTRLHNGEGLRAPLIDKNAWRIRELITLIGHGGAVNAAAVHPTSGLIASASADRTVRLWDATSGEEVALFNGHEAEVRDVAFSPDGAFIASASGDFGQRTDDSVRLWEVATGQQVAHLSVSPGHRLNAVRYALDGQSVLAGGTQGWVERWYISDDTHERFGEHEAAINAMTFADGLLITAAGSPYTGQERVDSTLRAFNLSDGSLITRLKGHTHPVIDVTGQTNNDIIVSVDTAGNMLIWDVHDGRAFGYQEGVTAVAFNHDGTMLAVAYRRPQIRLLRMDAGQTLVTLEAGEGRIRSLAFDPNGQFLVSTHTDGVIRVWGVTE